MSSGSAYGYGSSWTATQNKVFEKALALHGIEAPDCWHKIAQTVGGKSAEEVKRRYDLLAEEIMQIESGHYSMPNYRSCGNGNRRS